LELAGEIADGWLPTLSPVEIVAAGRAAIARGAARAGRDPAALTSAPPLNLHGTDDPANALPLLQFAVAIYYGPPNRPLARPIASRALARPSPVRQPAPPHAPPPTSATRTTSPRSPPPTGPAPAGPPSRRPRTASRSRSPPPARPPTAGGESKSSSPAA